LGLRGERFATPYLFVARSLAPRDALAAEIEEVAFGRNSGGDTRTARTLAIATGSVRNGRAEAAPVRRAFPKFCQCEPWSSTASMAESRAGCRVPVVPA